MRRMDGTNPSAGRYCECVRLPHLQHLVAEKHLPQVIALILNASAGLASRKKCDALFHESCDTLLILSPFIPMKNCCLSSSSCKVAPWLPRIGFGVALIGFGVMHYRSLSMFVESAAQPFSIPAVAILASALAYVVPALMIVGGALFAVRQLCAVSKICILASLSGIVGWAGLAIALMDPSSETSGQTVMNLSAAIQNASILLILYFAIKKSSCSQSCTPATSCCSSSCK